MVKKSLIIITSLLFCIGCDKKARQETADEQNNYRAVIDTVQIFHMALPLKIRVSGYADYWKKETILSSAAAQIISLLVEDGQKVSRNANLLSLWYQGQSRDFTPVDIRAPFDAVIGKIFVQVGSKIDQGKPLLQIYNDDFYSVTADMHPEQIKLVRKNQKVLHSSPQLDIEGSVESVDRKNGTIRILFRNNGPGKDKLTGLTMEILCGTVKGDYIVSSAFKSNKIVAYIDDESSFEIISIGISDSLSLINPGLPHLSKLSVIGHNN